MALFNKVIFVCRDNLCQSPIAEMIFKKIKRDEWITVESRGLVVLFPEPYSLKAHNLLRNNGIVMENGSSKQLVENDFSEKTLVLTMTREEQQKLLSEYDNAQNVFTIMEFAGGSGDIMDPYGGDTDIYSMFYTSIRNWVDQVEDKLHDINTKEAMK